MGGGGVDLYAVSRSTFKCSYLKQFTCGEKSTLHCKKHIIKYRNLLCIFAVPEKANIRYPYFISSSSNIHDMRMNCAKYCFMSLVLRLRKGRRWEYGVGRELSGIQSRIQNAETAKLVWPYYHHHPKHDMMKSLG